MELRVVAFPPREWESQTSLEPEAYYQTIRGIFSRNLPRYFAGRELVAISLTGGLDTRMIMAELKPDGPVLPCHTFVGMIRDCQDAVVARRVARLCGQSHQVIRIGEEFWRGFPPMRSEPCISPTGARR